MDFKLLKQKAKELCKQHKTNIYTETELIEIYNRTFYKNLRIRNIHGQQFQVKDYDEMWKIIQILV